MSKHSPDEILAAGRAIAKKAAPYFGSKLYGLVPREAPGLGTIATSRNMILSYDPKAVGEWTPDQMAGGWLHEILHLTLKFWTRMNGRDPRIWNVAQDIAINQMIREMGLQMPPDGVYPETFAFPIGLSSEQYYDLLVKKIEAEKSKNGEGEEGDQDGEPKPGHGHGKCGSGWCGGVAGNPQEGEPEDGDPDGRTEQEMQRQDRNVAEAMKDYAKTNGAGKIPSELLRWADVVIAPPKVPWQQKLAVVARRAVAYRAGAAQQRYNRPSRRQAGLGFGPGVPVLPHLQTPVPKIACGVDTSGSMGQEEGIRAVSEMNGILKAVGAQVTFCACDADVQSFVDVKTIQDVLHNMKGGGGTVMDPMFRAVEKARPSILVLITDGGWFDHPEPPRNVHVIILLVGRHRCMPPIPWLHQCDLVEIDD